MQISSLLSNEHCSAQVHASSKKKALEKIAQLAAENINNVNSDELFQSLINRERLGSTGIGHGIAIPHCRHQSIEKPNGICITLTEAVEFDAIDNAPVDIIFAVIVPLDADESHLQALASIAEKLQNRERRQRIRQATTADELHAAVIT